MRVEASEGVGVGEELDSSSVSGITSSKSIEAFEDINSRESGQLFDPQNRWLWHCLGIQISKKGSFEFH